MSHLTESDYKTCLLFQSAVSCATTGEKVLYICPEPFKTLPLHVHGMPEARHSNSQHIKFMYFTKRNDLLHFLSKFHSERVMPGMILLDDLHHYVGQDESEEGLEYEAAKVMALLTDTARFCGIKRGSPCRLLVSSRELLKDVSMSQVACHFFQSVWTVSSRDTQTFQMSSKHPADMKIIFYPEDSQLFLDRVEEG